MRLPINWSFAIIALIFIVFSVSVIYFAQQTSQNQQRIESEAKIQANVCTNGIKTVIVLKDGQPLSDNTVIADLNNLSCQIHVQGVVRADIALVCAFQVGDQPWVIGCPNGTGDFTQTAPPGKPITGNDVTTTFTKCSKSLLNPPTGYYSPGPGEPIQARAIRRLGSCTTDSRPIPWQEPGYYVSGTNFSLQTGPAFITPSVSPTTTPAIKVCSPHQCSSCVLNNRSDILPFYESRGWDVSCENQQAIIDNWCTLDPTACNNLKSNECALSCQTANLCPRGELGNLNCSSDGCINQVDLTVFHPFLGKLPPSSDTIQNQHTPNLLNDQSTYIDTGDYEILRQHFESCTID